MHIGKDIVWRNTLLGGLSSGAEGNCKPVANEVVYLLLFLYYTGKCLVWGHFRVVYLWEVGRRVSRWEHSGFVGWMWNEEDPQRAMRPVTHRRSCPMLGARVLEYWVYRLSQYSANSVAIYILFLHMWRRRRSLFQGFVVLRVLFYYFYFPGVIHNKSGEYGYILSYIIVVVFQVCATSLGRSTSVEWFIDLVAGGSVPSENPILLLLLVGIPFFMKWMCYVL